ncbi:60S acidic ribosomal protein P1 [Mycena amicta]|nr:60S acidic ribosomal protein P1 [Mycena amicta]
MASTDLAATYAALILADAESEITAEKILTLTTAANIDLEPIWATLLANALEGKNVKEMLSTVAVASSAAPTDAPVKPGPSKDVEEEKPESVEGGDSDSDEDGIVRFFFFFYLLLCFAIRLTCFMHVVRGWSV